MKPTPFYEFQQRHPGRLPSWRWVRAQDLVENRRYLSRKRDDRATGIAVTYLREMARCFSEGRLRRVAARFAHVHRARQEWEGLEGRRLEIETRMLARQTDQAIGYELNLPPETLQAYRDLFFHVDDRMHVRSYILYRVIGLHPSLPPGPVPLMQMSAYFHGPAVIEGWFQYLRNAAKLPPLSSESGRLLARIDHFVKVCALVDSPEIRLSLLKTGPFLFQNEGKPPQSVSGRGAFSRSTAEFLAGIPFLPSPQPPFTYAPTTPAVTGEVDFLETRQNRGVA